MSEKRIRVRFAPSPTGPLHIGGVRTALFNYLFAKKHKGDFILRIEDTDQTRFVENAENYINESLNWCGIVPVESPSVGGQYGPYRQSERKEIYKKYADNLINSGNAYYAFDTPEELEVLRKEYEQRKELFVYNHLTRKKLKNSLTLSPDEVNELLSSNKHYVIRFLMPENEELILNDLIRKEVRFNTSELDDKVLFKSDGLPTYHLANVVDDYLMKISHVIRGEEWLSSMPLHVLLYRALGWENDMPFFSHLPLILKPEGQGKLSKRDGDKMGFPVFPLEWISDGGEVYAGFRENGYLPDALVNFLALLGWNPGIEKEIFTIGELVELFSIERIGKAGSKFDPEKAKWFNHQYMVMKDSHDLALIFKKQLESKNIITTLEYVEKITSLVKDRIVLLNDFWKHAFYFFQAPESYDDNIIRKKWKDPVPKQIKDLISLLSNVEIFTSSECEKLVKDYITNENANAGNIFNSLRLCIVGTSMGIHLFDIFEIIGKEETINRIKRASDVIIKIE